MKNTYHSKLISFNFKNVFRVICFSLTNAMISCVTWSEASPYSITEVHGCCRHCTWCCQPVPPPRLPPSSNFHLYPQLLTNADSNTHQTFPGTWEVESLRGQCIRWMAGRQSYSFSLRISYVLWHGWRISANASWMGEWCRASPITHSPSIVHLADTSTGSGWK